MASASSSKSRKPDTKLIVLVGLPGAGKSTFSKLFQTSIYQTSVVNQDDLGRKKCQDIFLKEIKANDITILDRTNLTKAGRKEWIELSMLNKKQILCVHLATEQDECLHRANNRKDHPTVKFGKAGRIVDQCGKMLELPEESEGFSEVVTLYDEEDVRTYLKRWECSKIELEEEEDEAETGGYDPEKFCKFPRTRHLINLGGATRDDLLVEKSQLKSYFNNASSLTICEKVDGAQMGFSMDQNYQIKVQNRSHYVNSKSHKQFKNLDQWLAKNSGDLYTILQDPDHILFGEWLYAKHSIIYDSLPDYFLAFDLYNKRSGKFYNRSILEERCQGTEINLVRVLYSSDDAEADLRISSREGLLALMNNQSMYGQETIEGIYLKLNEGDFVKDRCKIVRANFIAGNEHWSKGIITPNRLTNYF